MAPTYPSSIDNGAGEVLTFLGVTHTLEGVRAEAEGVAQPGAGPPMHVHYLQEEAIRVVSGRLGYQVPGGEAKYATAGELAVFAPGVAHRWWNAGDTELHTTGWVSPPGNIEFFLGTLFASAKANGGRPSVFDAAFLITRYRSEYAMLAIPSFVQRLLFPVVLLIGRLLGKYDSYRNAPEPIR